MARTGKSLLAIDFGKLRIGVARCDALGVSTEGLGFIPRADDVQAAKTLAALAAQTGAEGIVTGIPLHADGRKSATLVHLRRFLAELRKHCPLPIHEVDERHSSQEAEEALRAEGAWPPAPGALDSRAAQIILRRYLDGE